MNKARGIVSGYRKGEHILYFPKDGLCFSKGFNQEKITKDMIESYKIVNQVSRGWSWIFGFMGANLQIYTLDIKWTNGEKSLVEVTEETHRELLKLIY